MKDSFERSLLEAGAGIKKGSLCTLADNAGKAIAAITFLICALVLFTDIGFSNFRAESFTGTLAVMLISSYLIYFSMNETGERLGEKSEEYIEAKKRPTAFSCQPRSDDVRSRDEDSTRAQTRKPFPSPSAPRQSKSLRDGKNYEKNTGSAKPPLPSS